jgi:hypothetical protein
MSGLDAPGPLAERLEVCWAGIAAPENRPFLRLFFEVFGVAAHQPGRFDEFLPRVGQRLDQRGRRLPARGGPARLARRWPASSSRCGGARSSTCRGIGPPSCCPGGSLRDIGVTERAGRPGRGRTGEDAAPAGA